MSAVAGVMSAPLGAVGSAPLRRNDAPACRPAALRSAALVQVPSRAAGAPRRAVHTASRARLGPIHAASASAAVPDQPDKANTSSDNDSKACSTEQGQKSWWGKLVAWIKKPSLDKETMMKMGTSALLAYGFVSNVNAISLLIIAWNMFTLKTGLSPLTAGQWGPYLLTYAALYATFGNLLRPARIMLAAALTPYFDNCVSYFRKLLKVKQPVAIGITVFLVNVCGTFSLLFGGLALTSMVTGMPILPVPTAAA